MRKIEVTTSVIVYDNLNELSKDENLLMQKAIEARELAYAPYSKFKVGAALILENGAIITGNNQESAAYPSGMCAERIAIWKAGSSYPKIKIIKMAISASSLNYKVNKPVGPCGACRQTMLEYEVNQKEPIQIIFMGEIGEVVKTASLVSLLPFSFDDTFL
jgi:cytidine deaminase